jgi:hypothetical protein
MRFQTLSEVGRSLLVLKLILHQKPQNGASQPFHEFFRRLRYYPGEEEDIQRAVLCGTNIVRNINWQRIEDWADIHFIMQVVRNVVLYLRLCHAFSTHEYLMKVKVTRTK